MSTAVFYDAAETRDPQAREAALMAALPDLIAHARAKAPAYAKMLSDVDARLIRDRAALAWLPVTRKSELIECQKAALPFGGLTAVAPGQLARLFASPGPIYDPEGKRPDYWRFARALFAAGFRAGQIVHNGFSYHLTPAGSMLETGAHALGCAVIPGGTGQTELQVATIADLRPDGYVGTPSFLRIILEKGRELGADLSSLKRALVSGEAFLPPHRAELASHGIDALQCYASADLGLIAYESPAREGMIVDEGVILEILRPGTGDPVEPGDVGEVVVTTFTTEYPLIRFATGDLSAVLPGQSPCGRTNVRIKGWMGRADQTTKIKGMFVHPAQVNDIVRRHPQIARARLVVDRDAAGVDVMTFRIEAPADVDTTAVAATLQSVSKLRGTVEVVAPGSLPQDGKVIDDLRKHG